MVIGWTAWQGLIKRFLNWAPMRLIIRPSSGERETNMIIESRFCLKSPQAILARLAPLAICLWATAVVAQSQTPGGMPPPSGMSLAESAAMRFPQPVRVGVLLNRDVLQPVESQIVLGTVKQVVRDRTGAVFVVIAFGGFLGFGARPIAIPVDATVLLGDAMEIVAFTPAQLQTFPTFQQEGATPVPVDTILNIGLAKPSH